MELMALPCLTPLITYIQKQFQFSIFWRQASGFCRRRIDPMSCTRKSRSFRCLALLLHLQMAGPGAKPLLLNHFLPRMLHPRLAVAGVLLRCCRRDSSPKILPRPRATTLTPTGCHCCIDPTIHSGAILLRDDPCPIVLHSRRSSLAAPRNHWMLLPSLKILSSWCRLNGCHRIWIGRR